MKKLAGVFLAVLCALSLCTCGQQRQTEAQGSKTVISGEFTVSVRDVIPDYCRDDFTPVVALVTEFQSYPFTVFVGEEIGSQLQKNTVYVFSVEPTEVDYSIDAVKKMPLSALAWEGIRISGFRLAEENELGLESLQLTYQEKVD